MILGQLTGPSGRILSAAASEMLWYPSGYSCTDNYNILLRLLVVIASLVVLLLRNSAAGGISPRYYFDDTWIDS